MVNAREIAKAFIEGRHYFDGRYLVVKSQYTEDRAIAYIKFVGFDLVETRTFVYISFYRDYLNRESVYIFVNHAPDAYEAVEIINEISDYIHSVAGVKITAFTIDNDNALFLAVKGYKYPFREYKNEMTILKKERSSESILVKGYYRRFALFRDCKACIEYAERIKEYETRIENLYNELIEWYSRLDYEQLLQLFNESPRRVLKTLKYTIHTLINRGTIVENIGIYLDKTPKSTYQQYERLYNKLLELVNKAKELYTLQTLLT